MQIQLFFSRDMSHIMDKNALTGILMCNVEKFFLKTSRSAAISGRLHEFSVFP